MGIEVIHIPTRCMYLCQPIDIGINKSIKTQLHNKWEKWIVDGEGIVDGKAMEPSRKMVAKWLSTSTIKFLLQLEEMHGRRRVSSGFR